MAYYTVSIHEDIFSDWYYTTKAVDLKQNLRHALIVMNLMQIEAVVLHALPFKEYDRILTLFSAHGLLKLFMKGKKREYLHLAALSSPLTHAEFHYTQGRKDLHRFSEGSILKQNLKIRERFETLTAAEKMIQAILKSQWPGKAAPKLFHLFSLFIEHLPMCHPETLYAVFLLKILRHEGILHLSAPIEACCRVAGERYPHKQAPHGALEFTEEEEHMLTESALCRSLTAFAETIFSPLLQKKIEILFNQSYN